MDMEKTGNYIKDKRKLKGWSQEAHILMKDLWR